MFYQACKVSGKNSTPCVEKKFEGTIVIEIELKPEIDMTVTCDCVGILKVFIFIVIFFKRFLKMYIYNFIFFLRNFVKS